jgi:hypothetical protein
LTKRMAVRQMRALYLNESKINLGKKQSVKKQSGGWDGAPAITPMSS